MDIDHIKNLLFSLKNKPNTTPEMGIEPLQEIQGLTPENLQKDLTAYVKACARKTGIEKSLVVRGGIERVHYSQKSSRVDYVYGVGLAGRESDRTCRGAGEFHPNIDGNRPTGRTLSASAPGADDGGNLTSQAVAFRNGTEGGAGGESDSGKTKRPDRVAQSSPFVQFVFAKIGAGEGNRTLVSSLGSSHSTIEPHPLRTSLNLSGVPVHEGHPLRTSLNLSGVPVHEGHPLRTSLNLSGVPVFQGDLIQNCWCFLASQF